MRRVFVHIGMMKAGSTAIQGALSKNRKILEAHGLQYALSPGGGPHLRMVAYAKEGTSIIDKRLGLSGIQSKERFRAVFEQDFRDEVSSNNRSFILSDERFASLLTKKEKILGWYVVEQVQARVYS